MIELNLHPDDKQVRLFALLLIPFSFLLGWLIRHQWDAQVIGWTVNASLAGLGLLGLMIPAAAKWLFVGWTVVTFPIGWLFSHLILAVIFYGLFFPFGMVARLFGYDPLQLKPTQAETYWTELETEIDKKRYFRQF